MMEILLSFLMVTKSVFHSGRTCNNGKTGNTSTKDVEIMVPLKYLSNFLRTLEISFINCEISPMLTWSKYCFLEPTFAVTNTRHYVPIVTLPTQENVKLLKQLELEEQLIEL